MVSKPTLFIVGLVVLATALLGSSCGQPGLAAFIPSFPVTPSNSGLTDPVSLHDFVPFGVALERLPDDRIVINREEGWTASNFIPFGMCWDEENTLVFHSSVNIGGSHFRLMFNDERFYRFLSGPSYYDESGRYFPYPTVHTNPANDFVNIIAYDKQTRTWYQKILDTRTSPPREILYVEGRGRLAPLWIGKPEGPFVVHGVAGVRDGWLLLDTWGGYLDFEELRTCRLHDPRTGRTYEFPQGFTFMDREYHRNLPLGKLTIRDGRIVDGVEFDCMSFHRTEGEEIEFIFCLAVNPLPPEFKAKFEFPPFERFGRIAFVTRGESYRFDDYEFWTDGKLQPDLYFLRGNFTDAEGNVVGSVDLTAEAYAFWGRGGTENWRVQRGTWWDPDGQTAWGRSFVKWRGMITLGEESIAIAGIPGFGEFMRYKPGPKHLSQVRVAALYASVIDGMREVEEVARLLDELHTGFVHRGFFRWRGMAEIERQHDVYGALAEAIAAIKAQNPHLLFGGAIAAQEINAVEYNPRTGQVIPQEATWEMALDPQEYGFDLSREELHERYWEITGSEDYIFPDLLDPGFQQLFLDHVKLQLDAGADAIWIDGLFWQAGIFARLAGSTEHPAIERVFEAIRRLVDEIHGYATAQGERVYVGSWGQTAYPYPPPQLDFVTISPTPDEVRACRLDEARWREKLAEVEELYGPVPVIAFIDWAFTADTPLGVFSQELTQEQAREALRNFERFFREEGVLFAYPVHGGYMGRDATKLSFGRSYKYESLAPEFETYDTIKELAEGRWLGVPHEYLPWYKAWDRFLEEMAQPPEEFHPMEFGAHLITANPLVSTFPEAYRQGLPKHPPSTSFGPTPSPSGTWRQTSSSLICSPSWAWIT